MNSKGIESEATTLKAGSGPELDDDWYLRAYTASEVDGSQKPLIPIGAYTGKIRIRGGLVALVAALGVAAGLGAAAVHGSSELTEMQPAVQSAEAKLDIQTGPAALSSSSNASAVQADLAEMERIKVRNRRLEALVVALRDRQVKQSTSSSQ